MSFKSYFKKVLILFYKTPLLLILLLAGEVGSASNINYTQKRQNIDRKQTQNITSEMKIAQVINQPQGAISVKDFGAIGNGVNDDTAAIQEAINEVSQNGGGIVFFPAGTYKVSIDKSKEHAISIRPNITLQGAGNSTSTIKLADSQGNYEAVIAGERPDSDVSDFKMYDIAVDSNNDNNPVNSLSDFNLGQGRFAVQIFIGSRIRIERCRFKNQSNTQTLITSITRDDENEVTDIVIKDNVFEGIGGDVIDYDHSTIYTHGKNIQILNNKFSTKNGAGTNGARTAIEIHGDEHIVKNNEINGYANGINVTGVARSSINQDISENIIKNAHTGITIWSYFAKGNTSNPALVNVKIANNAITLDVNSWRNIWGYLPSLGINLYSASDAGIQGLEIVNNNILFTNFSGTVGSGDKYVSGISLARINSSIQSQDIKILGNRIENSLASGIYISMPIDQLDISGNYILNAAQTTGSFDDFYKSAILANKQLANMTIDKNTIIDNQSPNRLKGAIVFRGSCTSNCQVKENSLSVSDGNSGIQVFRSESSEDNFQILQ